MAHNKGIPMMAQWGLACSIASCACSAVNEPMIVK